MTLAEKAVATTGRKIASILDTLAAAYATAERFADAASVQREAIALVENDKKKREYEARLRLFECGLPYVEHWRMGVWLRDQGKLAEAESVYREEVALRRKMFGKDDIDVTTAMNDLAAVLRDQGHSAEAETLAREALAIRERELPQDWRTFQTRSLLGSIVLAQKKHVDAEALLLSGYEGLKQREAKMRLSHRRCLAEAVQHLVQLYEATGSSEKAAQWKKRLPLSEISNRRTTSSGGD